MYDTNQGLFKCSISATKALRALSFSSLHFTNCILCGLCNYPLRTLRETVFNLAIVA